MDKNNIEYIDCQCGQSFKKKAETTDREFLEGFELHVLSHMPPGTTIAKIMINDINTIH